MSDKVFLDNDPNFNISGCVMIEKETHRAVAAFFHDYDAESAIEKINAFDDNQAIIKKQQEQIELLRHALTRISEWDSMSQEFRLDNGSIGQQRVIVSIAESALEEAELVK